MRSRWLGLGVVMPMLVFAAAVAPSLPERVPIHWNVRGEVDGWGSPWFSMLLPAGLAFGLWSLAQLLPAIDPHRRNFARFGGEYWLIMNLVTLFLAALQVLTAGSALGWPVRVENGLTVALGLLLVGMGNVLPRVRRNWWLGVRTPWTLTDERVWQRTQRVAGWCFVGAGVVVLVSALLPMWAQAWVIPGAVGAAALGAVVYSYVVWRRERRGDPA